MILLSGSDDMDSTIRTFAISVSPEMAPAATIVVYHVSKYMEVVTDTLTFPVNGISRNNVSMAENLSSSCIHPVPMRNGIHFNETQS